MSSRSNKGLPFRLALAVAGLVAIASPAGAQRRYPYHYVVKILCGVPKDSQRLGVVSQPYATIVNIHNATDTVAHVAKSVIVTMPPGRQRPVRPVPVAVDLLPARYALATECQELRERAKVTTPFVDGFLLVDSEQRLDVVAVYTVPGGIDVVHVPERSGR